MLLNNMDYPFEPCFHLHLPADAEGRLILCDAVFEAACGVPDVLIDAATLTGEVQGRLRNSPPSKGSWGKLQSWQTVDNILGAGCIMAVAPLQQDVATPMCYKCMISSKKWGGRGLA
jgi:hypothetical protein